MKKLLLVMNPYAGQKKANKYLTEIVEIFNRADFVTEVYMTAGPGDGAKKVCACAPEVDLVVCCGGDGTFNETVSGVLESGVDVPIGYIPAGSTNDFASSLKLSTDILKAAKDIVSGHGVYYDVGCFGGRYFSYVASFGVFTKTSYTTSQSVKNSLGHGAYVLSGIQELSQLKAHPVRLEFPDGRIVEDSFLFGAISNSTSVGGILKLAPDKVDMRDGKFEILLIRAPQEAFELTECIVALQKQTYTCSMITFLSATDVKITADPEMNWTLDGEFEPGKATVEIENLYHAVQIICPEEEA